MFYLHDYNDIKCVAVAIFSELNYSQKQFKYFEKKVSPFICYVLIDDEISIPQSAPVVQVYPPVRHQDAMEVVSAKPVHFLKTFCIFRGGVIW